MALVTGGAGMEPSGSGWNWRSQAPKRADVSLEAASGDLSAFKGSRACLTPDKGEHRASSFVRARGKSPGQWGLADVG